MGTKSVWLIPEAGTAEHTRWTRLIAALADTAADAPVFDPHLTLVGSVPDAHHATRVAQAVANVTPSLKLRVRDVQCSTTTHQCVFCPVAPSVPLLRARRHGLAVLDRPDTPYVPHVSLIYSDMSLARRVTLADAITQTAIPDRLRLTRVAVVDTAGPVSEWEPVRAFPLS